MIDLAKQLIEAEARVKEIDETLKEAKAERDRLNVAMADAMLDAEVQSLNVAGKVLYLNRRIAASYKKEIQDQFFAVLEGHGLGAIIKPNINSRTLTATVREQIEQNDGELPEWLDGMVDIFEETKVGIRNT